MATSTTRAHAKLVYLPFRAMAETSRMMFAYGKVEYSDEAVWGLEFLGRKQRGDFPWGKTPVLELTQGPARDPAAPARPVAVVAQSGAIARYAAKLAGCLPAEAAQCALSDSVYELGQELCTINPLVNCYTGRHFEQVRAYYFNDVMPSALPQLENEITRTHARHQAASGTVPTDPAVFFGGAAPTHADFNVFHHLDNAMLLEPGLLEGAGTPRLADWFRHMLLIPELKEYLDKRPVLNGIGKDPGLEDRNGVRVTQRAPPGRAWLVDGCWVMNE